MPTSELRTQKVREIRSDVPLFFSPIEIKNIADTKSVNAIDMRKASPPIVGVPALEECHDGPPSYMGCLACAFSFGIRRRVISEVVIKEKSRAAV